MRHDPVHRSSARDHIEAIAAEEGLEVLGWRDFRSIRTSGSRRDGMGCMPYMAQLFLAVPELNGARPGGIDLDRRVYPVRKLAELGQEEAQVYFASLSNCTIAYKGMLTTMQLPQFFSVCGDAHRGTSLIVWAVAEGRSAAHAVDAYLMGESDFPRRSSRAHSRWRSSESSSESITTMLSQRD